VGRASEFDAVFYPGGHGPVMDLTDDKDSIALLAEFAAADKVISGVCHGTIAFANVKLADGSYLVKGQEVTGFSDEEEDIVAMTKLMPYSLEKKLKEAGAIYKKADKPFGEMVLSANGGKLISGQNPASATATGEAIAKALKI
jgi:putative intracellular protease/amidase